MTRRPAVLGGEKAFPSELGRYVSTGEREAQAALGVLKTGILSDFVGGHGPYFDGGPRVRSLEQSWCDAMGSRYAVSVSSATAGLHAALVAAGVRPGDEVVLPPITMSATAMAVLMAGAVPVFVDVEAASCCIDPGRVEAALGPRTRAILAVNLFGGPAELVRLRTLADTHGVALIEDNAQGAAGRHRDRVLGTIGHLGVFSLNCHKTIQCGEGGVVVTDDERMARRLRLVRNHGENVVGPAGWLEDVDVVGCNYRLTELQAAVAEVQLDRLEELTLPRIAVAGALDRALARFSALRVAREAPGDRHVYYVYPMYLDAARAGLTKEAFATALVAEGAPVVPRYVRPLYHLPIVEHLITAGRALVREPGGVCAVAERLWADELLYTTLIQVPGGLGHVEALADAVGGILSHASEVATAVGDARVMLAAPPNTNHSAAQ